MDKSRGHRRSPSAPGAAALAALLAAIIAFETSALAQNRRDRISRQEQWWTATTWAADKALSVVPGESLAGFRALTALTDPNWQATPHQALFIASLSATPLDHYKFAAATPTAAQGTAGTISKRRRNHGH